MRIFISSLIFIVCGLATAQVQAQTRCKWVKYDRKGVALDTLSLVAGSLQIKSPPGGKKPTYDINTNRVSFAQPFADSILVCYQVLPFLLNKAHFKRDIATYNDSVKLNQNTFLTFDTPDKPEEIFKTPGIQKSGSLTRGVGVGNQQSVFVNSALNLQLEGKLTKDIQVLATISDQQVPFQPEGNTQQLQEFDKVFIQFRHKSGSRLTVGDVVFQNQPSQFLRYYKNVQGGYLELDYQAFPEEKQSHAETKVGIAISKGKFASVWLNDQLREGVQGPYRLQGPNGERFIIILANSEKVYLDGQLLQRGFNFDYTIDYNNAQVTFNTNVVITQFSRVRVDFEYADRNYNRTITTASHYQQFRKFSLYGNYFSSGDNPNNPLGLDLSDADIDALSLAGDDPTLALASSIDSVGALANQVLYRRKDTVVNGQIFNILQYAVDSSAIFRVSFTEVGVNRGDYQLLQSTANGRVFGWVAPVNGVPQGSFAPVKLVPTPTLQKMMTVGAAYQLSKQDKIYAEMAFSERDLNRFSDLDNADNQGRAWKVGYLNQGRKIVGWKGYRWLADVSLEWNEATFLPIDRYRSVEFDRDWSINADTSQVNDLIFRGRAGVRKDANNQLMYSYNHRVRGTQVNGWQQKLVAAKRLGIWQLKTKGFLMNNRQTLPLNGALTEVVSQWQRFSGDLSQHYRWAVLGYNYSLDQNRVATLASDSVVTTAMNFDQHRWYIQNADSARFQWLVDYSVRYDNLPVEGKLKRGLESHTVNARLNARLNRNQQVKLIMTYRTIDNKLDTSNNVLNADNIMGRIDWNAFFFNKSLRSQLTFATSTGRELRREFVFIPVNGGQGTHTWRDDNEDGIQDLNEFYLAINLDERNFIKVFVPTDDFISAFTNNFSYRAGLRAPFSWRKSDSRLRQFVSKWSANAAWTIVRRMTDDDIYNRFVPFSNRIAAIDLLSTREIIRSTLFFNRANPSYGFTFNFLQSKQKQLLTNGFEASDQETYGLILRRNLGKSFNLQLDASADNKFVRSDFLQTRNYNIISREGKPALAFQPNPSWRLTGFYRLTQKMNTLKRGETDTLENAQVQEFGAELRVNIVGKRSIVMRASNIRIDYRGELNNAVAYEMLEALQPGSNWRWSVNWQQRLGNGLRLTLVYEGRNTAEAPVPIHSGRAQITALF
ncbi:hypothetical protein [Microscilla marina]|uniref:hypothetical protein n=1 Tax=Microscilla marina TaxID=1027 RepID=UPI0005D47D17|nr:hypothetical protein [Microscilla marina]